MTLRDLPPLPFFFSSSSPLLLPESCQNSHKIKNKREAEEILVCLAGREKIICEKAQKYKQRCNVMMFQKSYCSSFYNVLLRMCAQSMNTQSHVLLFNTLFYLISAHLVRIWPLPVS